MSNTSTRDPFGAFVPGAAIKISGARSGPLSGVAFAAKDLFDIAGQRTGAGNPDYLHDHPPAKKNAWAIQTLLDAGAELVGRAVTVELAYGMSGDNVHYGMPVNPGAPDRVPGGSSCGSATAVAGRLVDTALGTDTGGSVRTPASYCGVYGMRPTPGRIPLDGVVPLATSCDTIGHFARDPDLFERVGRVLLRETGEPPRVRRVLWAEDLANAAEPATIHALAPLMQSLMAKYGAVEKIRSCPDNLENWAQAMRVIVGSEAWRCHGDWITSSRPNLGADVAERFRLASRYSADDIATASKRRTAASAHLDRLLADDTMLCFPTVPGPAPLRTQPDGHEAARYRAHALGSYAVLGGLPQISIPGATVDGGPVGLSLLGARGTDASLLRVASEIAHGRAAL